MKLSHRLFQLLILFLPTQLAYHFWPPFALIRGLRVDYLAPTLYFTDLLLLSLIASWFFETKPSFKIPTPYRFPAIFILLFLFLNLVHSHFPILVAVNFLRLLELFLFYLYLINHPQTLKLLRPPLFLGVLFTLLLSLLQITSQKTIGGLFYWFGERTFSVSTPAIAQFSFFGHQYLRPYATFPHPNTLAGFMLVTSLFLFPTPVAVFPLILVFLSFSQNAWLAVALLLIASKVNLSKLNSPLFLSFLILSSFILPFTGLLDPERQTLSLQALKLFSLSPLVGVGLGSYLPAVVASQNTYLLQPVHNIFLLLLAEIGLLGLLLVLLLLSHLKPNLPLLAILLTGLLDHYWLTQHQTQLLLVLVLAFSAAKLLK